MTDPHDASAGAGLSGGALVDPEARMTSGADAAPRSLWSDAWHDLRRSPLFLVSVCVILVMLIMAAFPQLFTSVDPNHGELARSRQLPSSHAWFGYDNQGYDIFARVIYGARASILVGVLAATSTVLIGATLGMLAAFYGGWLDALCSRIGDVFVGLPFVLGAIVILTTFNTPGAAQNPTRIITQVVASMAVLSWPVSMRIMRSAVLAAREQDYVKAARALGASSRRIILRHLLPNCVAPVLVYATIALGAFIGVEATLSFLGIGLRSPVVSWGVMISDARYYVRVAPHMLLFPAAFLTTTVLAFVMLGDAIREALDPKLR
jgi:oligopeptide transport system permease protein